MSVAILDHTAFPITLLYAKIGRHLTTCNIMLYLWEEEGEASHMNVI